MSTAQFELFPSITQTMLYELPAEATAMCALASTAK